MTRPIATEKLLACIAANDSSLAVVQETARLAHALQSTWLAVYVETPSLARLSVSARERILAVLHQASQLGAETFTLGSIDIARTILEFAQARGVTRIIVGRSRRAAWLRRLFGSVVDTLVSEAGEMTIQIVAADRHSSLSVANYVAASGLESSDRRSGWTRYLTGAALLVITSAIGLLVHPLLPNASIVTLYLLTAMLAGLYLGQGPAIFAAIGGGLSFNFLFTEPRFTLHIYQLSDLLNFAALLTAGLVVAQLSARARHQARVAVQREERAVSLGAFTGALLSAQSEREIAIIACEHIGRAFDSQVDLWLQTQSGKESIDCLSTANSTDAQLPLIRRALENKESVGGGTLDCPDEKLHYMPVLGADKAIGVLTIKPRVWKRLLLPEPRKALQSYGHQLALALERVQLLRHKELAEHAMRAEDLRNNLLAGLSHDLRTPLASILGSASALVESGTTLPATSQRELIATIHEETLRMTRLVTNLLEMARLTHGAPKLNREWIPLEELIGSVRHRLAPLLIDRCVQVTLEPNLPLAFLDGLLFEQVLQNLLENAVKYSPIASPIEITARQASLADESNLVITVADRGVGVPEESKEAIFEKFHRVHEESAQSGMGLGLALCRSIVSLHGGSISVVDRAGGGSEFRVTLPLPAQAPGFIESRHPS